MTTVAEAANDTFTLFGVMLFAACVFWLVWHAVRSYFRRFF